MQRYSNVEKLRAVELYIKYGKSPSAVWYELGYQQTSNCLCRWYQEYLKHGNSFPVERIRKTKYSAAQRKAAVEYYQTHGKSI